MASATRLFRVGQHNALAWMLTRQTTRSNICNTCQNAFRRFSRSAPAAGVFEPDDLKLEPDIPEYPTLNIQMQGYDFVMLESYSKYVHGLADAMGFDTEAWPVPAKCIDLRTFKPNSVVTDNKYSLKMFERNVQMDGVPSPRLAILLEMMRTHAPEGVKVTIKEPVEAEEEFRYIPDKEMRDLRQQIKAIEEAREERRKK